jgi:hypothetical protein
VSATHLEIVRAGNRQGAGAPVSRIHDLHDVRERRAHRVVRPAVGRRQPAGDRRLQCGWADGTLRGGDPRVNRALARL